MDWICLPKIYMNASQYEEVKDGSRGMRGMPRRSREWRFVPSGWKNEESEDRHEGDVQRAQFPAVVR